MRRPPCLPFGGRLAGALQKVTGPMERKPSRSARGYPPHMRPLSVRGTNEAYSIKDGTDGGIPEPSKHVKSFQFLYMIAEGLSGEVQQLQQSDAGLLNEQGIATIGAHIHDDHPPACRPRTRRG